MKVFARFIFTALLMVGFTKPAYADLVKESVSYRDGDVQLEGYVVYDSDIKGKVPGVLISHEWWGHNQYVKTRAEDYAKLGYVAFALDIYGKGIGATNAQDATKLSAPFYADRVMWRKRANAGLDQLLKHPKVDALRVGALGYCFGGTTSLELARSGAPLKGIISFHGGLNTPIPDDMKNFKGKLLVLNGAEDPFVKPEERAAFMDEVRKAKVDWQFVEFGGAVHAFSNPAVDAVGLPGAAYNKLADERSFQMSVDFLKEIFKS